MEQIFTIREIIIHFYKRYETVILFILKFLVGLIVFNSVNKIGLYRGEFAVLFESGLSLMYLLLLCIMFAVLPPSIAMFLVVLEVIVQISLSPEVAFFIFLLLVMVIIFYVRLAPRQSFLILAILFGFYFKVPYAVAIFAGIYCGLTSIIPLIIGTAIWSFLPFFTGLVENAKPLEKIDFVALPQTFLEIFDMIFTKLTTDFNWMMLGFVFAMIVLAVYAIGLVSIDYAKDIAVCCGGLLGMISMLMVVSLASIDMSIIGIIFGSVFSVAIVELIRFFDCVLDYQKAERVQFDDEDNYYYVKIIPKVIVLGQEFAHEKKPKKKVVRKPAEKSLKRPPAKRPASRPVPRTVSRPAPRPAPRRARIDDWDDEEWEDN